VDPKQVPPALLAAARSLSVDQVTAEVVAALRAQGVRPILLKGPAFAQWLYDEGELRPYVDTDLLVAPEHQEIAAQVLADLGFVDEMATAAAHEVDDHSRTFTRGGRARQEVDLHFTLAGAHAHPDEVWVEFASGTETVTIAGEDVDIPSLPARALHVTLHAAQGDHGTTQHLDDLVRAVVRVERDTWRDAALLAERLGATGAFVAGLERLPSGRSLLSELGVEADDALYERLRTGTPPPMTLGVARLLERRDRRGLARELFREVIPSRAFMRVWSPLAARGPAGLAAAYAWRPFYLAIRLPGAVASYARVKRMPRPPRERGTSA
jgi:hypothetical protein